MKDRKHETHVEGYERSLDLLVERVHRMRYDEVSNFYAETAEELRRQAEGDRGRGRVKLAALLEEAALIAEKQQEQFSRIWKLCEPHMEKE